MHKEGDHIGESPVEAPQSFLDRPVLIVLVASCMLAVIFLALSYAGVFSTTAAANLASSPPEVNAPGGRRGHARQTPGVSFNVSGSFS
jgi:hypothetical protein